jgi:hypothetical protein
VAQLPTVIDHTLQDRVIGVIILSVLSLEHKPIIMVVVSSDVKVIREFLKSKLLQKDISRIIQ